MSEQDDRETQWLRDAFAQRPATDDDEDAVEAERLWDAVGGALDGEQTAALADRIAADPRLAEEWRLAIAAREEMAGSEDVLESDVAPRSMGWGWLVAAAAAVVLVWAVVPSQTSPTEELLAPQVRGGDDAKEWGAASEGRVLRWDAVPGSIGYRVLLFGPDMTPLHETAPLEVPKAVVPESIRGAVFWRIEVELQDRTTQRSPLFEAEFD